MGVKYSLYLILFFNTYNLKEEWVSGLNQLVAN